MKMFFVVALVVSMMAFPIAKAEGINLSSMSYQELIALQQQLNREIISRPEWKEVTVPIGTWKVGEDIPAGTYGIKGGKQMSRITIYSDLSKDWSSVVANYVLSSSMFSYSIGRVTLEAGQYIEVDIEAVVFTLPMSLEF